MLMGFILAERAPPLLTVSLLLNGTRKHFRDFVLIIGQLAIASDLHRLFYIV